MTNGEMKHGEIPASRGVKWTLDKTNLAMISSFANRPLGERMGPGYENHSSGWPKTFVPLASGLGT